MEATDYQVLWDLIHSLVDEQKKEQQQQQYQQQQQRIEALEEEVRDLRAQLQQQQQQWQASLPLRPRPAEVQEDATSAPPASVEADMAESSADPAPATTTTTTTTELVPVPPPAEERRCFVCGSLDHIKKNCPKRRRAMGAMGANTPFPGEGKKFIIIIIIMGALRPVVNLPCGSLFVSKRLIIIIIQLYSPSICFATIASFFQYLLLV
ncbi:hypothetical protein J3E68DRAFT_399369 [Trichoderma sp. SZMC 28012]